VDQQLLDLAVAVANRAGQVAAERFSTRTSTARPIGVINEPAAQRST
jgi:hypothetical protein